MNKIWTGWEFTEVGIVGFFINPFGGKQTVCTMSYNDLVNKTPKEVMELVAQIKDNGKNL